MFYLGSLCLVETRPSECEAFNAKCERGFRLKNNLSFCLQSSTGFMKFFDDPCTLYAILCLYDTEWNFQALSICKRTTPAYRNHRRARIVTPRAEATKPIPDRSAPALPGVSIKLIHSVRNYTFLPIRKTTKKPSQRNLKYQFTKRNL